MRLGRRDSLPRLVLHVNPVKDEAPVLVKLTVAMRSANEFRRMCGN